MNHPWINQSAGAGANDDGHKSDPGGGAMEAGGDGGMAREGGANGAQDERRKELIERLEKKGKPGGQAANQTKASLLQNKTFELSDKRTGKTTKYEWRSIASCKEQKIIDLDGLQTASADVGKIDVKTVSRMLEDHNID